MMVMHELMTVVPDDRLRGGRPPVPGAEHRAGPAAGPARQAQPQAGDARARSRL